MALPQINKPIQTRGLFNPSGAAGRTYDEWMKSGIGGQMPSIAPKQADDSVVTALNKVTATDNPLMQAAKTEGLKIANRRGLGNSSIAAGAVQDATLRAALPIAQQEAQQAFGKNQAARAFEYGMAMQDRQIESAEFMQLRDIESREGLAAAQRALDFRMQQAALSAAEQQQLRDIASREGMAAAERELQLTMQVNSLDNATQQQIRDIRSREGLAAAERALNREMQIRSLDAADQQQIRDIEFREGVAAAERALQELMQQREINYQSTQRRLDRALQERLASWNLNAADRNAAAQLLYNMETLYQSSFNAIMSNPNMSAEDRTAQLASARNLRDRQIDFVQQLYDVQLEWGQARPGDEDDEDGGTGGTGGTQTPAPTSGETALERLLREFRGG
ncbi:MAG: hypothetical protein K5872_22305 [Rhizobiaceae bacterium]|nr:hypothetical protein [Rhizobiaceae bacterium]MCV0408954.1 hypothetical protein [Rhizobiaceae bacterium]